MSHQITMSRRTCLFAQPGETVLQAALREGFPLPYGCRNGACGTCKGKIVQGAVEYGSYNGSALTETESRQAWRFFVAPCPSELVIECREIGAIKDSR